jgi:thiamine kinase-like enzyme
MSSSELVKEYIHSKEDFPIKSKLLDVNVLSGGMVNHVYRLTFEDNTMIVLKYYPDHLASNSQVKWSQKRYFVEKEALRLLATNEYLINHTIIRVPKLIYHDDQGHILVMEYAGRNSISLFEFLKLNNVSGDLSSKRDETIDIIAHELFKFSDFLSNKTDIKHKTHDDPFLNEATCEILDNWMRKTYKLKSIAFEIEKEIEPFIRQSEELEIKRKENPDDDVFVFGDLWPNSILVDQDKKLIWVIDWEMARFETRLSDINQFICNLWIMKQNPFYFDSDGVEKIIRRLQFEFFKDENIDWRIKCGKSNFIIWVMALVHMEHWQLDDHKKIVLKALREIQELD